MHSLLARSRGVLVLGALAAPSFAQSVWIVDAASPTASAIDEIQDAVDFAANGDTIVVLPGSYAGFVIDGLDVEVVARDGLGSVSVTFTTEVRNLGAGQTVSLRGLQFFTSFGPTASLLADDNAGSLFVEDFYCSASVGVELDDCANVVLTDGTVLGRPAIRATNTNLYVYESEVLGFAGNDAYYPITIGCSPPGFPATSGGDGIEMTAGTLYASGANVAGGDGGSGASCPAFGLSEPAKPSGDGLALGGVEATVSYLDTTFSGGSGGSSSGAAMTGTSASTVTSFSGVSRELTATSPVLEGHVLQLTVRGEPAELITLMLSVNGVSPIPFPIASNAIIPAAPWIFVGLGLVPASGEKNFNVTIKETGFDVTRFHAQASLKDFSQIGTAEGELTNPVSFSLLDRDTFANDCNGNGVDDLVDIATGASDDVNGNKTPDECLIEGDCDSNGVSDVVQVTQGAPDVNQNFVPDACESFAVLRVDDDAPGDPVPGDPELSDPLEDGSAAHPFDSLGEAVDAASTGDVILVADGVYTGELNRNVWIRFVGVTIVSENGPANCIIDCQMAGGALQSNNNGAGPVVISGFTFRLAFGSGGPALSVNETPTVVRNCVFEDNTSFGFGGAINWQVAGNGSVIEDCVFERNSTTSSNRPGGAISAVIELGELVIRRCTFRENVAVGDGGAIRVSTPLNVQPGERRASIRNCEFVDNSAVSDGGAIESSREVDVDLENCLFADNFAEFQGGAVSSSSPVRVRGCTFFGNQAGPNFFDQASGGAIRASGPLEVSSTILWGNEAVVQTPTTVGDQVGLLEGADAAIFHCLIQGGSPDVAILDPDAVLQFGPGNLDTDPLFLDPALLDLHLSALSPCIDAGDPTYVPLPSETDLDGEPRLAGAAVDMGSDETQ